MADLRLWYLMISQMAEPNCVKLSGVVGGNSESDLGQKKIQNVDITLTYLCTRDDPLGFEDCRLATHLLNLNSFQQRHLEPRHVRVFEQQPHGLLQGHDPLLIPQRAAEQQCQQHGRQRQLRDGHAHRDTRAQQSGQTSFF